MKSDSILRLFFEFLTKSKLGDLRWLPWDWRGIGATGENDAATPIQKATYQCVARTGALSLSLSFSLFPPPPPSPSHVYACVHFSQGLRLRQASHIRWMNSTSVLPAVCFLPPKGSSRDSDSKAWSRPRSLFAYSVRAKAIEGSKMESEREIIDLQVSSL